MPDSERSSGEESSGAVSDGDMAEASPLAPRYLGRSFAVYTRYQRDDDMHVSYLDECEAAGSSHLDEYPETVPYGPPIATEEDTPPVAPKKTSSKVFMRTLLARQKRRVDQRTITVRKLEWRMPNLRLRFVLPQRHVVVPDGIEATFSNSL